jgi:hypothetical protein
MAKPRPADLTAGEISFMRTPDTAARGVKRLAPFAAAGIFDEPTLATAIEAESGT